MGPLASNLLWRAVDCHEKETRMLDGNLHSTLRYRMYKFPHPPFASFLAYDLWHLMYLQQKRVKSNLDEVGESSCPPPHLLHWDASFVGGDPNRLSETTLHVLVGRWESAFSISPCHGASHGTNFCTSLTVDNLQSTPRLASRRHCCIAIE